MLAGPRKRQKISADPRNKHWIEDPNQFGRKLMEKMGWSDGKGLGTKEDGEKDFIKVALKANSKGLGYNKNEEENWISHQDDFNDLLSQLHEEHSSAVGTESQTPQSIEERSKNSKKRVHYKKFTRGKDLANRSIHDMNCIFGKRSGSSTPQSLSAPTSDNESENHGVKTITNTVSMQDYFAQKMLKRREGSKVSNGQVKETDRDGSSPNQKEAENDGKPESAKKTKKKEKKKRKRKNDERKPDYDGEEEIEKEDEDGVWGDCNSGGHQGLKSNKTSKETGTEGKGLEGEEEMVGSSWTEEAKKNDNVRDSVTEEMTKKKKKKKKKKKQEVAT